jgi:hypothetical protein
MHAEISSASSIHRPRNAGLMTQMRPARTVAPKIRRNGDFAAPYGIAVLLLRAVVVDELDVRGFRNAEVIDLSYPSP